jgi:hypothetical protein
MKSLNAREDYAERLLPQSGDRLHNADAILSSFPRILSDRAAAKVLFILWKREADSSYASDGGSMQYAAMTIYDATKERPFAAYRKV